MLTLNIVKPSLKQKSKYNQFLLLNYILIKKFPKHENVLHSKMAVKKVPDKNCKLQMMANLDCHKFSLSFGNPNIFGVPVPQFGLPFLIKLIGTWHVANSSPDHPRDYHHT